MSAPSLPPAASAESITEALRRSGVLPAPRRVLDVTVLRAFPTVLSHLFRLQLTYDAPLAGAPSSLMLKAGLADRPGGPWRLGQQEISFYTDVAPTTPAGLLPRCFDAQADEASGTWHLLLEDLSDTHETATAWPLPPTFAQGERIMRARARFQAAWWNDPRLGESVGSWQGVALTDASIDQRHEQYRVLAEAMGDRLSARRRDLFARLFDQAPRLMVRYATRRHMTIVQGDSHIWNCFLPRDGGGDARLFDWDAWRVDLGARDLAYMMALHWYPDVRREMERPLLDRFHDELLAHGVQGYDRRALQDDYRLSVLWHITTPVWQHAVGIPPLIWWNNLERVLLAVDDLDCRSLL